VNVFTELPGGGENWAVKNVPIRFSSAEELDEREGDGFHFNLGIDRGSMALTSLNYRISVEASPLTTARGGMGPFLSAPVTKQERLVGGEISFDEMGSWTGGSGQAEPSIAQNYDAEASANFFDPLPGGRAVTYGSVQSLLLRDRDVVAVDERRNHCAPGAVTRGLHALKRMNPSMPLTDNVAQTQAALAAAMMTTEEEGTSVRPVNKLLEGKNAYVAANRLQVTSSLTMSPGIAADALSRGGVAEIGVFWGKNARGESMGGHRAFVAEIEQTFDANMRLTGYRVRVIDDPRQGDMMAGNTSYWLTFRPDGSLVGYGAMARLNNFLVENYIVPTPGPAALIAAAGFIAARRRRAA
jgi:hypothetical protein